MEKIGLIAGNGRFPLLFARSAAARGASVVAVAHRGETLPELEQAVSASGGRLHWIYVGQLNRLIRIFKEAGVKQVVMAGGIKKTRLFLNTRPDLRTLRLLRQVAHRHDDALLRAVARELEAEGLQVGECTLYLSHLLADKGVMTRRHPTSEEWEDIRFGWEAVKEIGRLDIGQCVVVKQKVVLAVEAVEGTDEAIRRGGRLCQTAAVVVKASKPHQDLRFDVPAVGPSTLDAMQEVKAAVLALEAGRTLILDREAVLEKADKLKISLVGLENP